MYVTESWVVMEVTMPVLEGFHNRIARRIVGMTERRDDGG